MALPPSTPGGAPGIRHVLRSAITRCRLACFLARWGRCRSCLETASCTGIGGRCEPAAESADDSDDIAHGHASPRGRGSFRVGTICDPPHAEESRPGIRIAELLSIGGRGIARARLSRRHSTTEAAKARAHHPATLGAQKSQSLRHPELHHTFESFLRRALLKYQRSGAAGERGGAET